eukprot:XP_001706219.1 Hypothetical protein GL50803_92404 [Giardia lamblia ATCC 50803]
MYHWRGPSCYVINDQQSSPDWLGIKRQFTHKIARPYPQVNLAAQHWEQPLGGVNHHLLGQSKQSKKNVHFMSILPFQ